MDKKNNFITGVGATVFGQEVVLVFRDEKDKTLKLARSKNGLSFIRENVDLNIQDLKPEDTQEVKSLHLTFHEKTYYMCLSDEDSLRIFASNELLHYGQLAKIETMHEPGMIVPDYKKSHKHMMIFGDKVLKTAYSKDLINWEIDPIPLLTPNYTNWEQETHVSLSIATIATTPKEIILVYYLKVVSQNETNYSLQAVILDKKDPKKILGQTDVIWENTEDWAQNQVNPIGAVFFKGSLLSFWGHQGKNILAIKHTTLGRILDAEQNTKAFFLRRADGNPVIAPSSEQWENRATFNPGAVVQDDKVHLVYRAIGDEDTSVIGYARSNDGVNLSYRSKSPAFIPKNFVKLAHEKLSPFISGGGFGGCEDPRITRINGKIYMTYVAFDGVNPPRSSVTSIPEEDFFSENWNWSEPVFISRPGVVNKNAVIFSETVRGKFVVMHRVFPNILIDYWDDLEFDGKKFLRGDHAIKPRPLFWDSRKIGAGPPPLKTDDGWLLIYHGVGDQDAGRYKIGAMLLDSEYPEKVIARSYHPVLQPEHHLENAGHKSGVVYPCGSVIKDGRLIVYYGGADTVALAATADIDEFTNNLKRNKMPTLETVTFKN